MNLTIRHATHQDGDGLLEVDRACLADGRGMIRAPGEHAPDGEAYLERIGLGRDGSQIFVACLDGRVVGESSAKLHTMSQLSHVAMLAVQVHPEAQGRGIGRALMEAALAWCRERDAIRIQLFVRADNDRAIALYRSLDFEVEAVRRRFIRAPDGRFLDDLSMVRFLDAP